ncbi:MAG: hypothetical protein ACSHW4_16815, partial [Cellulophaga sp.]
VRYIFSKAKTKQPEIKKLKVEETKVEIEKTKQSEIKEPKTETKKVQIEKETIEVKKWWQFWK